MKRVLAALLALGTLALTGCAGDASSQVESQAYALSLGVEKLGEKEYRLTAQIPSLGGRSESGRKEGGGSNSSDDYLITSAVGRSFTEALDMLTATVPYSLQLSQLKTVVFSEETARDEGFSEILREMVFTYQLYAAASCIVCRGSAKDFLEAQRPVIGTRLSRAMTVELEHYQSLGYTPSSTLADVFYAVTSIYGDPVAILAARSGEHTDGHPARRMGDELPGEIDRDGPNQNEYLGLALFRRGSMAGTLTGAQTKLVGMLTGQLNAFSYSCQDVVVRIRVLKGPQIRVDLSGDAPQIDVALSLRVLATDRFPKREVIQRQMLDELNEVTAICQRLSVDPFNYALYAASQFLTTRAWLDYAWQERFPQAHVSYQLSFSEAQT